MVSNTRKRTRPRTLKKRNAKTRIKRKRIGGKEQWNNFKNVGTSLDDFFTLFNIDELSKKSAKDNLAYKTFKRNNKIRLSLIPSTIRDNQYGALKITQDVTKDAGLNLMDEIAFNANIVDNNLGNLLLGRLNISGKNNRKGTFHKEIIVKEPVRDNLPSVEEPNIATFVDKRFKPLKN